jgi:hypothetical protein
MEDAGIDRIYVTAMIGLVMTSGPAYVINQFGAAQI